MKNITLAAIVALCLSPLVTLGAIAQEDYSFLKECVKPQERIDPIGKILIIAKSGDYLLLDLVGKYNKEYVYPAVVKLEPACDLVWANPDNDLGSIGIGSIPKEVGQDLIDQRLQSELRNIGSKQALFKKYNQREDDGYLWLSDEELTGLKKLGYKPKLKVRNSPFQQ